MRKQWKRFLKENDKNRLYASEYSYCAVPWLVNYLHKSMKKGNQKDVDDILKTLNNKHSIVLDDKGNLCFTDDYLPF